MKVYDVNPTLALALVRDDSTEHVEPAHYTHLMPEIAAMPLEDIEGVYLSQLHYVARAKARGLVIIKVEPMREGWLRIDSYRQVARRLR